MDVAYLKNFQESSALSRKFYSQENINSLSNRLRYEVWKKTQVKIGPVNTRKLLETMTSIFIDYAQNNEDSPTQQARQLVILDNYVVERLKVLLISNVRDYFDNLQDLDNPNGVYIAPTPINVSHKKTTGNRGQADILFGDTFYSS